MLFKSGLIPEGFQHSLHVTLGGASDKGGGMCLILSGLELLYATPERIVSATEDNQFGARSTWARRGEDGIRRRPASMLDLCQTVATELRTLSVSSSEQARSIFFDAQMLTTTLLAFRSRQETSEPLILEIADIWPVYRSIIKRIWEVRGLPAESWGSPHRHADIWVKWADSLSLRDQDGSMEYTTACQVREISTRTADLLVKLGLS